MQNNRRHSRTGSISRRPILWTLAGTIATFAVANRIGRATALPVLPAAKPSPASATAPPSEPPTEPQYRVTELPVQYGVVVGKPLLINSKGDIAGTYEKREKRDHKLIGRYAFFYHDGKVTELADETDDATEAVGLNNRGQVLLYRSGRSHGKQPFLWQNGKFTPVGPMPTDKIQGGFWDCEVCGINDKGQVAGTFIERIHGSIDGPVPRFVSDGGDIPSDQFSGVMDGAVREEPFRWQNGSVTILTERKERIDKTSYSPKSLGFYEAVCSFKALAINEDGEIVGMRDIWRDGNVRAVKVLSGANKTASLVNGQAAKTPTRFKSSFRPYSLLNRGEWVVTRTDRDSDYNFYEWSRYSDAVRDTAYGINEKGQVVGMVDGANGTFAFLWQDGTTFDLNKLVGKGSGINLEQARGINDSGTIIATGGRDDGDGPIGGSRAYILTPIKK